MVDQIRADLSKLEAFLNCEPDPATAAPLLTKLKIALTTLPNLQPGLALSNNAIPEITIARDVYEVATLISVHHEDESAFERHVAQVKTYYVDYASILPKSSRQNLVLSLNLMRLMAQNRIAEFHTELELIPTPLRSDPYISYVLRLENYLMEGSYAKIREEKISIPHQLFNFFVDNLMITVREEIAACSEKAYTNLAMESAQTILSITDETEMREFCEQHGWRIANGTIHFADRTDTGPKMNQVPSEMLIRRTLEYARELEQII